MRVSLIGEGRMARTIEQLAGRRKVEVVRILGREENRSDSPFQGEWLSRTEVFIDFSTAAAVPANIEKALAAHIPIVIGTTGWGDLLSAIRTRVAASRGSCLYSSNFSLGMQVFNYLVGEASRILSLLEDYDPYLMEAHHRKKIDSPSGTAKSLQEILRKYYSREIEAVSIRAGWIPGTHQVGFDSRADSITLKHAARNREGFAAGALAAAQWLIGRPGFFTMEDMFQEVISDWPEGMRHRTGHAVPGER